MSANQVESKEDEEEEDYMNMVIAEPTQTHRAFETYTQKRMRKEREARNRGQVKSKKEQALEERHALEKALATPLFKNDIKDNQMATTTPNITNKGFAMMSKMGYKLGNSLGRSDNSGAILEPVKIQLKDDRGGLGLDKEKKRKWSEFIQNEEKKSKAEELEYRERIHQERDQARLEVLVVKAMRIAESMSDEREEKEGKIEELVPNHVSSNTKIDINSSMKSQKQPTNVLWRGLVRKRQEKERLRHNRHLLHQSLSSRLPTYDDSDAELIDKWALNDEDTCTSLVDEMREDEDTELDEFNSLCPLERLQKLLTHLRVEHNYCFWCKFTYPDQSMHGCPGPNEEDHD